MTENNAVMRVLGSCEFMDAWKVRCARNDGRCRLDDYDSFIDKMMRNSNLDKDTDRPLPDWALFLLGVSDIGYKWRVKIVLLHHFLITGVIPSSNIIGNLYADELVEIPQWLKEIRERRKKEAEELLKKKGLK